MFRTFDLPFDTYKMDRKAVVADYYDHNMILS